jgi:DNA-binding response OmpR family regulator
MEAGFAVYWESTGSGAISRKFEPDLFAAVVDIGLPDFSGEVVARELRAHFPALPIILSTGCDSSLAERIAGELDSRVLMKPYRESLLLEILQALPR